MRYGESAYIFKNTTNGFIRKDGFDNNYPATQKEYQDDECIYT